MQSQTHPLSGQTVVVTGAGSGIGLATVELLASYGAHLGLADISDAALQAASERLTAAGAQFIACQVDICSAQDIASWLQKSEDQLGAIVGAVNCAGILQAGPEATTIDALSDAMWLRVIDINLNGTFKCLREEIRRMSSGGSIVNVGSSAGTTGIAGLTPYCASKHAINGLTKSAAKECAGRGIRVNCVAPGIVDTAMVRSAKPEEQLDQEVRFSTPLARMGSAQEIAESIAFLLSANSSFITGAVLAVDGGMTA